MSIDHTRPTPECTKTMYLNRAAGLATPAVYWVLRDSPINGELSANERSASPTLRRPASTCDCLACAALQQSDASVVLHPRAASDELLHWPLSAVVSSSSEASALIFLICGLFVLTHRSLLSAESRACLRVKIFGGPSSGRLKFLAGGVRNHRGRGTRVRFSYYRSVGRGARRRKRRREVAREVYDPCWCCR